MNKQQLNEIMLKRGIFDVITDWGWLPHQLHNGRWGWYIPITEDSGRWKAGDSEKPKYLWQPAKPDNAMPYYIPQECSFAIANKGAVVFCEGETDMAALYSIGVHHVACWYDGAKSIPSTIVEDVKSWGCSRVSFVPDYDKTGLEAGIKFYEMFQGSDIAVYIRQIPSGYNDVNDCLVAGAIGSDSPAIGVWDIQELRDTVAMMQGDIAQRPNIALISTDTHEINERVIQALTDAALAQGGKPQRHKGYTAIPVLAPKLLGHKRDSVGQHAYFYPDACLVFDYAKRATVKGMQLCQEWGVDYRGLGGWYKEGYKPTSPTHMQSWQGVEFEAAPPFELPANPIPDEVIVSRRQLLERKRAYITNPKQEGEAAILNPMLCLRGMGGFGELLGMGKVMLLGLPSGHGKTISVEMFTEQLLNDGYNVMVWSGEWTPDEMAGRAIQQNGGASLTDFYRDSALRAWAEHGLGKPDGLRYLSYEQKARSQSAISHLLENKNDAFYFDCQFSDFDLEQTMSILFGSAQSHNCQVVVFDYAQLAPDDGNTRTANRVDHAFQVFKARCIKHKVVGIMTSQVNKAAVDKVEATEQLTASDFAYLNINQANLAVGMWRMMIGNQELPFYAIRIFKNNLGDGRNGVIFVEANDLANLRIDFTKIVKPSEARAMIHETQQAQGLNGKKGYEPK